MKNMIFAVIDIGSYETTMKIGDMGPEGIDVIDYVQKVLPLGKDTFLDKRLKNHTIGAICDVLNGFKSLMQSYGVSDYRAVGTSGFREAKNQLFAIEQIENRTGIKVSVLSNANEKYFMYKAAKSILEKKREPEDPHLDLAFLNIGYGNVQISLSGEQGLNYHQGYKIGSLRINEVLSDLERNTSNFAAILENYLAPFTYDLNRVKAPQKKYELVVYGREMNVIRAWFKNEFSVLAQRFFALRDEMDAPSFKNAMRSFQLRGINTELSVPTILIINQFAHILQVERIFLPDIGLADGIIKSVYEQKILKLGMEERDEDIINYCRALGRKYFYDETHAKFTENTALIIYDALKKQYKPKRARMLLQIGAILHDIGKFTNTYHHAKNSFELILASDIPGLGDEDLEIIAYVAKYHDSQDWDEDEGLKVVPPKRRMLILKLAALLNLANCLDQSNRQSITGIQVENKKEGLVIHGVTAQEHLLEAWMFEKRKSFFQEVYGMNVSLVLTKKEA